MIGEFLDSLIESLFWDEESETFNACADINGKCYELEDVVVNFLELKQQKNEIKSFTYETERVDCGPGYETGFVFVAWCDKDSELKSRTFQWECF